MTKETAVDNQEVPSFYSGSLTERMLRAQEKKGLREQARFHLDEFVKLSVIADPHRSVPLEMLTAQVIGAIRRMEREGVFFLKEIPARGNIKIYTSFHCYGNKDQWKGCPEWSCPLAGFSATHAYPSCPHYSEIRNPRYRPTKIVSLAAEEKNKHT